MTKKIIYRVEHKMDGEEGWWHSVDAEITTLKQARNLKKMVLNHRREVRILKIVTTETVLNNAL